MSSMAAEATPPKGSGKTSRRPAVPCDAVRSLRSAGCALRSLVSAVADLSCFASPRRDAGYLSFLCWLVMSISVTSGCATSGHSSVPASEKKGGAILSDRSFWGWLQDAYGTH